MITMSSGNGNARAAHEAAFETPFLDVFESPVGTERADARVPFARETPFTSEYLVDGELVRESSGLFRELLDELYDQEFDEALVELADEADARTQLLGLGETAADYTRAERALHQWMEPLRMEAEALLEAMAEALNVREPESLTEAEVDELLDGFEPRDTEMEPVFEDFLKKVWKKAKKVAKKVVQGVKKGVQAASKILPTGIILKKIKQLVRPLLERVLKLALNRLPPALRPAAQQLAKRFLGTREVAEMFEAFGPLEEVRESPASPNIRTIQVDFDAEVASLLLASDEPEQEALFDEVAAEAAVVEDGSLAELDRAREEFVAGLMELEEGEDSTPLVEQFLPAILPVLRMGIGVIGRSKIVKFLAGLLGRLISPYVGPKMTPPLSQAIVDAGLRLMTLEATGEELGQEPRLAAEAFAAVVEDTAAAVAELDEADLQHEHTLEETALEAFRRAAGSQFPQSVVKVAGDPARGTWVGMPRHGRKRYRKYSRVLDVTVRPGAAAAVKTRAGRTLATVLRDRLGKAGAVNARMHLYQAIPGTRLGTIAHAERAVAGLGRAAAGAQAELHPLTHEAAGMLLGDPELGHDVSEAYLDELGPPAVGQRFYYLEVGGGRPAATGATRARPRLSTTTAGIDVKAGQLVLAVYLSEAQAQAVASQLRKKQPIASTLAALRAVYQSSLHSLITPAGRRRVRIVAETNEMSAAEKQFIHLPGIKTPRELIGDLLVRWTRRSLAADLERQREAFVAATAAPEDGVTLLVTLTKPPGLATLGQLMRGRVSLRALSDAQGLLKAKPPTSRLEIVPGYRNA